MANMALDGGDPRFKNAIGPGVINDSELPSKQALAAMHDPDVTLEEYLYYANLTRAEEYRIQGPKKYLPFTPKSLRRDEFQLPFKVIGFDAPNNGSGRLAGVDDEKKMGEKAITQQIGSDSGHSDEYWGVGLNEWQRASRARRTATWGAVFCLITTDILGPSSVGWALSQMGWGPGIALYFIFGILAFYAGLQIYQMFLRLDSIKYPLITYGDLAFRIYGKWARLLVNCIQSLQLFFNVGILILGKGQSIHQLSVGPNQGVGLCFVVCSLVFAIAGFMLGQIRTLARFGWLANLAVWTQGVLLILTMVGAGKYAPNYVGAAKQSAHPLNIGTPDDRPPITTVANGADNLPFEAQVVGLMQAVYSYGGAMLYCEFMAEMKRPWDFFKAQIFAEIFVFGVYVFFGSVMYAFQGQFATPSAWQGLSYYPYQTAANSLALIAALIAAALYGNIGIKVIYNNIFAEIWNFPPLESRTGRMIWAGIVPLYWVLGFVVCSAIPNITSFGGLIAAVCIMQFSYTFPPFLMLGFDVQRHAILAQETFDPSTGRVNRVDQGWKRWARGFKKEKGLKVWYIIFSLGALATAVLGTFSSIKSLISAFESNSNIAAFSCKAPI